MLQDLDPNKFDLAVIQEPVVNLVNLTTLNMQWRIIYPTCHNNNHAKCTQSLIPINKQVLKEYWRAIPLYARCYCNRAKQKFWKNTHI
ncbi:hypothetical protein PAXRUDRAFT_171952 [Paxillus rubicundulus Ve08.2h10]|uniref:Endonuclease/exonuclease/phosphatase domain-containing protein n=1 Tax=Paxillus rubicundulus Ve08.2h10 TaxID=930991 RepID=A0A0D0DE27_9AGAM|nr:hypothetical protein PAXRUDRAFT_171952 [Paxillus rubicundulus Ve08.2h10]